MKASTDGGPYKVCIYASKAEAQEKVDMFVSELDDECQENYRIVPRGTPAEFDLY